MRARIALLASLVVLLSSPAWANCADQYYRGSAPRLAQSAARDVRELCYDDFAVGHSGLTHTPLWSGEHLTASKVVAARALPRRDDFHAEEQLPGSERAELADYRHSGYDRGHMAPSGDMPTPQAQDQSFTLANIAPQAPSLNRGLWEEIEVAVRDLALADGEVFVVTGPVFNTGGAQLNGRVRVPSAVFKAIYDPRRGQAGAYVADNVAGGGYRVVSIAALRDRIGFDVFPSLGAAIKARAMALPAPERHERQALPTNAAPDPKPALPRIPTAFSQEPGRRRGRDL